ncbi:hypothetical protein [Protofrankia coriariae]|uniref:hypothetical protein n=1 Tax=Protofrankia coriariae TaxID=1562887 RepID=UPI001F1E8193|nr:hypothetical protein [Protofrankia coriariae]
MTNDGQVHYHAIPNIAFASAVEMAEKLVDAFPDDFGSPGEPGGSQPDGSHGPAHQHHD